MRTLVWRGRRNTRERVIDSAGGAIIDSVSIDHCQECCDQKECSPCAGEAGRHVLRRDSVGKGEGRHWANVHPGHDESRAIGDF